MSLIATSVIATSVIATSVIGCGETPPGSSRTCQADRDCESGVCVSEIEVDAVDQQPLPLVCADAPDAATDRPCCQSASDCTRGICLVSGACVLPCVDATDCSASERCAPAFARASETALQTLHACVSRVELPSDVQITESLLPGAITADTAGFSIELPGDPSSGTATRLFVLEHPSETLWPLTVECRTPLCVRSLETRDTTPTVLFDSSLLQPGNAAPLNTVSSGADSFVSTILLPNGPRSVRSENGYRIHLASESAGDLRLTEVARTQRGTRLDLHLHYVGAGGLRPEGTRGPQVVADALDRAESLLGQAGVTLGDVCQTETVGDVARRLSRIDPPRFGLLVELPELFALSAGARGGAVHVFLVDQSDDLSLGISGGLPGPPGMHGTGSSGVVMSVSLFDDGQQLGRALAHELGHYLGLFHPRESDDVTLDPLGDTPNAPTNLMFLSASGGADLTESQRDVIRTSPLLY